MKFIRIVALLAPAVLAATQATEDKPTDWISLLQQQCADMPIQCLDIAKDVHQADTNRKPNIQKDLPKLGACNPAYVKCISKINTLLSGDSPNNSNLKRMADAAVENVVTCLLQILPDHFKYMANPASAKTPFPPGQSCPLRDLHRAAHAALAVGGKA